MRLTASFLISVAVSLIGSGCGKPPVERARIQEYVQTTNRLQKVASPQLELVVLNGGRGLGLGKAELGLLLLNRSSQGVLAWQPRNGLNVKLQSANTGKVIASSAPNDERYSRKDLVTAKANEGLLCFIDVGQVAEIRRIRTGTVALLAVYDDKAENEWAKFNGWESLSKGPILASAPIEVAVEDGVVQNVRAGTHFKSLGDLRNVLPPGVARE